MKQAFIILVSMVSASAQAAPDFSCAFVKNNEAPKAVSLERIGNIFTYSLGSPLLEDLQGNPLPPQHLIGIDYYPGIKTIIMRIREKDSDRMQFNRVESARDGFYNLEISSTKGGIFGDANLKSFQIQCILKGVI